MYLEGFSAQYIEKLTERYTHKNPQYVAWKQLVTERPWLVASRKEPVQYLEVCRPDVCAFPVTALPTVLAEHPDAVVRSALVQPPANFMLLDSYSPWEHQAKVVEKAGNVPWGIVVSGTGSGKTKMMIYLIATLGYRALFVVPNVQLMKQALADAREVVDCTVGQWGDGRKTFGDLTVATIQTLYKADLSALREEFGTVVFDEVDMYPMAWRKVLSSFAAAHRYGDTATHKRGDGNHRIIEDLLGRVIYTVPNSALVDQGILIKPEVEWVDTNYEVSKNYKHEDRPFLLRELINSQDRNKVIEDVVRREYAGNKMVLLTDEIRHVNILRDMLADLNPIIYHGQLGKTLGDKKRKQEAAMEKIRTQPESLTIATMNSMGRGTNVPGWNRLVVGLPFTSRTRGSQIMGRITRSSTAKDGAKIIDFKDGYSKCQMIRDMYEAREAVYEHLLD
jgi:superfamily II DNA or RNA helicase